MFAHLPSGRAWTCGLLLSCLLSWAGKGEAATVNVQPTRVHLSSRSTSGVLTLRNDGDQTVRFQLSMFAWTQEENGATTIVPSKDLVFHPPFLTLAPKESRKVRVGLGSRTTFAATEKTYRLLVEEMPSPDVEAKPNAVTFLTNLSLPVFVTPPKAAPKAALDAAIANGSLSVRLRNEGNAFFQSSGIVVRGIDKDQKPVFEQPLDAWYVLAGKTRKFDLPIPRAECLKLTALIVDADTGGGTLSRRVEVAPRSCTP